MAVVPCKPLLLLFLVAIFCFSTTTKAARSLGVPAHHDAGNHHFEKADDDLKVHGEEQFSGTHDLKVHGEEQFSGTDDLKVHGEEQFSGTDDLVAMDYTPASKKPPIHN